MAHIDPEAVLDAMLDADIDAIEIMFADSGMDETDAIALVVAISQLLEIDQPTLAETVDRIVRRSIH